MAAAKEAVVMATQEKAAVMAAKKVKDQEALEASGTTGTGVAGAPIRRPVAASMASGRWASPPRFWAPLPGFCRREPWARPVMALTN